MLHTAYMGNLYCREEWVKSVVTCDLLSSLRLFKQRGCNNVSSLKETRIKNTHTKGRSDYNIIHEIMISPDSPICTAM